MSLLRLYKDFYRINFSTTGETYTLINPLSISATIVNRADDSLIESPIVLQESNGIYYVEITPSLYSYLITYEVRWNIVYVTGSPAKMLKTRFRIEFINTYVLGNIISNIEIDVDNSKIIEYFIEDSERIIEINI